MFIFFYSKAVEKQKAAVEEALNLSNAMHAMNKTEFEVDVFEGPLSEDEFRDMIFEKFQYSGNNSGLYDTYSRRWLEIAEPKLIEAICELKIKTEEELEEVLGSVLELEYYCPRKADIEREVRKRHDFA